MKKYEVIFGGGYGTREVVEVEEETTDYGAILDILIDRLEEEGKEGYFISWEETSEEGGQYNDDEYVIGGNHGRILYHGGMFQINLIN